MASPRIQSLQVLRAFAAIGVAYVHDVEGLGLNLTGRYGLFGNHVTAQIGAAGVDLFFVISGAIIYLTAIERRAAPGPFTVRRLQRVVPLFWIMSAAWLALRFFNPDRFGPMPPTRELLATVTLWPAWDRMTMPALGPGWSLSFELLFYGGAALVLLSRRWLPVLVVAFAAMWVVRDVSDWVPAQFLGNPIIIDFIFGVTLLHFRRRIVLRPVFAVSAIVAGVALLAVAPRGIYDANLLLTGSISLYRVICFGVPAAMIVCGALSLEPYVRGRTGRVLVYLGNASYSIYLVHGIVLGAIGAWVKPGSMLNEILVPLALAAAVGAGCLAYELVEKPLLAWMYRGRAAQPQPSQATAS